MVQLQRESTYKSYRPMKLQVTKWMKKNHLANEIKGFISCWKNQQPRRSHVLSHANVNFSSKTVANRVTKLSEIFFLIQEFQNVKVLKKNMKNFHLSMQYEIVQLECHRIRWKSAGGLITWFLEFNDDILLYSGQIFPASLFLILLAVHSSELFYRKREKMKSLMYLPMIV